jgi:predicted AlkP superfamily pyrophosphatase or phosphodiesterase
VYPHNKEDIGEIKDAMELQSEGKNYTVYLKKDIPARFHYQNNVRIPEILLLADVGWTFGDGVIMGGAHGYDPQKPDMHAVFTGYGPSFPRGKKIKSIPNVEVYEFLCGMLEITPRGGVNSTGMLKRLIDE